MDRAGRLEFYVYGAHRVGADRQSSAQSEEKAMARRVSVMDVTAVARVTHASPS